MKRYIIALLLGGCSIASVAQEPRFMGIPIQGTVHEFSSKLISTQSAKKVYEEANGIILSSKYMDSQCLFILKSDEHRSISEIDVKFPVAKTWTELETRYLTLRNKLINLYGTPVYSEERFDGYVHKNAKLDGVLEGKCFYSSEFSIPESSGFVRLFINRFSDNTASVVLRHNRGTWSQEKFKSIFSDLSNTTNGRRNVSYGAFGGGHSSEGHSSGGHGIFELPGRSFAPGGLPIPECNAMEEGRVVVNIIVNPAGKVIGTSINKRTNTISPSLRKASEEAARKAQFNAIEGVNNQSGTITYYFKLQ